MVPCVVTAASETIMKLRLLILTVLTICLAFFFEVGSAGAATPRQPPGSFYFGPSVFWTDGTTSDLFQPLSSPMPSSQLVSARVYFEITEGTGSTNLRTRPAIRYSADGVNWDAPTAINVSYVTGSGVQPGTTFVDLTTLGTPKAWIQFGLQAKNNNAGVYEFGHAVLIVEPKGR